MIAARRAGVCCRFVSGVGRTGGGQSEPSARAWQQATPSWARSGVGVSGAVSVSAVRRSYNDMVQCVYSIIVYSILSGGVCYYSYLLYFNSSCDVISIYGLE